MAFYDRGRQTQSQAHTYTHTHTVIQEYRQCERRNCKRHNRSVSFWSTVSLPLTKSDIYLIPFMKVNFTGMNGSETVLLFGFATVGPQEQNSDTRIKQLK